MGMKGVYSPAEGMCFQPFSGSENTGQYLYGHGNA